MSIALTGKDFKTAERAVAGLFTSVEHAVAMAIAEERERCATIAENFNTAGKNIADAIRRS